MNTGSLGLKIHTQAGTGSPSVTIGGQNAHIFDGQNFAMTGNGQVISGYSWYEIYLTTNCSQSTGWCASADASGQYLTTSGCPPTWVNEVSTSNLFDIYPNPSLGIFTIETKEQDAELSIFNLMGENIISQKIQNEKFEIDLSNQPNGIYFVNIKTEQGITNKKIIINK